jgi:uncharacterized membrane protein YeaQ/YmgE (transglycosylase-associated protein family)
MLNWLISLITGAVGGNIGGALLKKYSLGVLGNTLAGVVGGGLGKSVIGAMMGGGAAAVPPGMGADIAGSGIGGIVLMVIIGLIKQMMAGKKTA